MTTTINAKTTGVGGVDITGDTSGVLGLQTGGVTRMTIAADGTITGTVGNLQLISGTAVASTSGTSIDFTGIPSWVKRVTVMFSGVSTNGASLPQIQIGAGSVQTSGYAG